MARNEPLVVGVRLSWAAFVLQLGLGFLAGVAGGALYQWLF